MIEVCGHRRCSDPVQPGKHRCAECTLYDREWKNQAYWKGRQPAAQRCSVCRKRGHNSRRCEATS